MLPPEKRCTNWNMERVGSPILPKTFIFVFYGVWNPTWQSFFFFASAGLRTPGNVSTKHGCCLTWSHGFDLCCWNECVLKACLNTLRFVWHGVHEPNMSLKECPEWDRPQSSTREKDRTKQRCGHACLLPCEWAQRRLCSCIRISPTWRERQRGSDMTKHVLNMVHENWGWQ